MLGVIGGTGLYALDLLNNVKEEEIETPFGKPSAPLIIGSFEGMEVAFLPRHGVGHVLLPSEINFLANIYALKKIGVKSLLSVSAVGSLNQEVIPGTLALPSQYIDFTKSYRKNTFFGNSLVAHISSAEPVCDGLVKHVLPLAKELSLTVTRDLTYVCVEGPRLGTKAESFMFKKLGADLVGMTNIPEVFLAREAQMCYASICVVTDFDSWMADPSKQVSVDEVLSRYKDCLGSVQKLLQKVLAKQFINTECPCRKALESSVVTAEQYWTKEQKKVFSVLTL